MTETVKLAEGLMTLVKSQLASGESITKLYTLANAASGITFMLTAADMYYMRMKNTEADVTHIEALTTLNSIILALCVLDIASQAIAKYFTPEQAEYYKPVAIAARLASTQLDKLHSVAKQNAAAASAAAASVTSKGATDAKLASAEATSIRMLQSSLAQATRVSSSSSSTTSPSIFDGIFISAIIPVLLLRIQIANDAGIKSLYDALSMSSLGLVLANVVLTGGALINNAEKPEEVAMAKEKSQAVNDADTHAVEAKALMFDIRSIEAEAELEYSTRCERFIAVSNKLRWLLQELPADANDWTKEQADRVRALRQQVFELQDYEAAIKTTVEIIKKLTDAATKFSYQASNAHAAVLALPGMDQADALTLTAQRFAMQARDAMEKADSKLAELRSGVVNPMPEGAVVGTYLASAAGGKSGGGGGGGGGDGGGGSGPTFGPVMNHSAECEASKLVDHSEDYNDHPAVTVTAAPATERSSQPLLRDKAAMMPGTRLATSTSSTSSSPGTAAGVPWSSTSASTSTVSPSASAPRSVEMVRTFRGSTAIAAANAAAAAAAARATTHATNAANAGTDASVRGGGMGPGLGDGDSGDLPMTVLRDAKGKLIYNRSALQPSSAVPRGARGKGAGGGEVRMAGEEKGRGDNNQNIDGYNNSPSPVVFAPQPMCTCACFGNAHENSPHVVRPDKLSYQPYRYQHEHLSPAAATPAAAPPTPAAAIASAPASGVYVPITTSDDNYSSPSSPFTSSSASSSSSSSSSSSFSSSSNSSPSSPPVPPSNVAVVSGTPSSPSNSES